MKRFFLLLLLLFSITSCAPWMQGRGLYESPKYTFTLDIPQEWMRLNTDKYLLISRDGPFLQYVLVQERHIDRPFRHTKKRFQREMLPQEAAEVVLDEISSDQSVFNFLVIENVPATIGRHEGFRIIFKYRNKDGLAFKTIYYGLIVGERFYSMRYNAAERYYFEKDLETFKRVLNSFTITGAHPA